jgi:1-acyl-sn-glycerol-3-phosphate acyltransferase
MALLVSILRFMFRTTKLLLYFVLWFFPSMWLVSHYRRSESPEAEAKADAWAVHIANCLCWVFGIRIKVVGEVAPAPVLITANHLSWLDIITIHSACAMGFVAKAEIDDWLIFGYIARTGGTIFHRRGSHDSATGVATLMVERLKQGRRVAIFPEGGIEVANNRVRVFHARMFKAAVDAQCPVQPVMVRYMGKNGRDDDITFRKGENMMVNIGRILSRPGTTAEIHFLPVIDAIEQPRRVLAEAARDAVAERFST